MGCMVQERAPLETSSVLVLVEGHIVGDKAHHDTNRPSPTCHCTSLL